VSDSIFPGRRPRPREATGATLRALKRLPEEKDKTGALGGF